jgi:hypothetical protein
MTVKTPLGAADLFVLLDREFRRRKSRECQMCFVQLPFRVDARDADAPNWEVLLGPDCDRGCTLALEEIVAELQDLYALQAEGVTE